MRTEALIRALILGAATLATAGTASAEVLSLVCRVQETKGTAHRVIGRRLDIDLGRKTVRISDNVGRGWVFKNQYPFLSADRQRIRLESGGGKDSYVDRVSGTYFFHNQADGVTMRGPCHRAPPERPRF
ncbi:MAG: hypothetical protein JWO83_268 [Caulobacteraceae bacterium]|jgi:hypothetical protein|nr:hypothetical protein [Caulobacteraceae bacterium]